MATDQSRQRRQHTRSKDQPPVHRERIEPPVTLRALQRYRPYKEKATRPGTAETHEEVCSRKKRIDPRKQPPGEAGNPDDSRAGQRRRLTRRCFYCLRHPPCPEENHRAQQQARDYYRPAVVGNLQVEEREESYTATKETGKAPDYSGWPPFGKLHIADSQGLRRHRRERCKSRHFHKPCRAATSLPPRTRDATLRPMARRSAQASLLPWL